MDIDNIPPRSKEGNVHALVEIPKGSQNKYEYSKEYGVLVLDRTQANQILEDAIGAAGKEPVTEA